MLRNKRSDSRVIAPVGALDLNELHLTQNLTGKMGECWRWVIFVQELEFIVYKTTYWNKGQRDKTNKTWMTHE